MSGEQIRAVIVAAYRRDYHRDTRRAGMSEVRTALRDLRDRLQGAVAALEAFDSGAVVVDDRSALNDAAAVIGAMASEQGQNAIAMAQTAGTLLLEIDAYAARAGDRMNHNRHISSAARNAARNLWARGDELGVRVAATEDGTAVRMLVEIAREAGDASLTAQGALKALKETRPK
jgi:hypothetical protein